MSELDPLQFAAQNMSQVFSAWLHKDAQVSSGNANHVLDNFDKNHAELGKDVNIFNSKSSTHISRLVFRLSQMTEGIEMEGQREYAAYVSYRALSLVSSGFRGHRMLVAKDDDENMTMKFFRPDMPTNPIGVNVPSVVSNFITTNTTITESGLVRLSDPSLSSLQEHAESTAKKADTLTEEIIDLARAHGVGVGEGNDHPALAHTKELQSQWLTFAAHSVLRSAACYDDDLTQIPILEPRSETDNPDVIQPFGLVDADNNTLIVDKLLLKPKKVAA